MEEAYAKGSVHQIVRVMLENPKGLILLQKRSPTITRFPNRLDHSVAGHVDEGEAYETAAQREMFEEIGLKDIKLKEIAHYYSEEQYKGSVLKRFNKLYQGKINFTPKNLSEDEVAEVRWFDINDIKKLVKSNSDNFTPGLIEVIKKYY